MSKNLTEDRLNEFFNTTKIDVDSLKEIADYIKDKDEVLVRCRAITKGFKSKIDKIVKVSLSSSGDDLKPGDLFIGKRNTGWELGVCSYVETVGKYVISSDENIYGLAQIYPYDCWECKKVIEIWSDDLTKEIREYVLAEI